MVLGSLRHSHVAATSLIRHMTTFSPERHLRNPFISHLHLPSPFRLFLQHTLLSLMPCWRPREEDTRMQMFVYICKYEQDAYVGRSWVPPLLSHLHNARRSFWIRSVFIISRCASKSIWFAGWRRAWSAGCWLPGWLAKCLADWLAECLACWITDWLNVWFAGWLNV